MAAAPYRLRFWGVRGTVPTPAVDKLRFGGNTSCLAVELGDGTHLILDCGTGIRVLGNAWSAVDHPDGGRFHIFFTHYHFDHVEGLPLFQPLYDAKSTITIYGARSGPHSVRDVLAALVRPPYFPVTLSDAPSRPSYIDLDGSPRMVGDVTVSCLPLNHPDGSLSFRLERGARRIVYATDHEHGKPETDRALIEFARDADYLIYDATYAQAEYEALRRGWGHSTWYAAVQTALAARVRHLVLFHHHPEHSDEELARVLDVARAEFPTTEIAHEGLELPL